jgi:hypothetical protein
MTTLHDSAGLYSLKKYSILFIIEELVLDEYKTVVEKDYLL